MDCSTPGFPVLHYLPEFAQTHAHCVGDAIQQTYSLLRPYLPALNLPQHQGLFQWVGSLHQVDKVLELQYQSFQWIFRVDFLQDWLVWSPCCPRHSQESFLAPQFERISSLMLFPLAICFTYDNVYVSILLSQFVSTSPSPAVFTSLFSMLLFFTIYIVTQHLTCMYDSVWECVWWRKGENTTVSISGAEMSPLWGCTPWRWAAVRSSY